MEQDSRPLIARPAGLVEEVDQLRGGSELVKYVESVGCPVCLGHTRTVTPREMRQDKLCYFCGGTGRVPREVCAGCGLPAGVAAWELQGGTFCGDLECLKKLCCTAKRWYDKTITHERKLHKGRRHDPLAGWAEFPFPNDAFCN